MCTGVYLYVSNESKGFLTQKKKYMNNFIWGYWDFNIFVPLIYIVDQYVQTKNYMFARTCVGRSELTTSASGHKPAIFFYHISSLICLIDTKKIFTTSPQKNPPGYIISHIYIFFFTGLWPDVVKSLRPTPVFAHSPIEHSRNNLLKWINLQFKH